VVRREENQGEEQEHHHHRDEEKEQRWWRKWWQHQWQAQEDHCRHQQHHQFSLAHRQHHRPRCDGTSASSNGCPAPVFFLSFHVCCEEFVVCEKNVVPNGGTGKLYMASFKQQARWGVLACVSL